MNEAPAPTFVKTKKSDKKTPPKQAAIPHAMVLNKLPKNSKLAEEACGWGPQCPICAQFTQNLRRKTGMAIGKEQRRKTN